MYSNNDILKLNLIYNVILFLIINKPVLLLFYIDII